VRKGRARTAAALHGELIDHSAFRRIAQEARAAGQRDGGPVAGPGRSAERRSHTRHPDWKRITGRIAKRFHACVKRTIYSVNNTAIRRHRRFKTTSVSNEIRPDRDKNRHAESDKQNPAWLKDIRYSGMYWGTLSPNNRTSSPEQLITD
jgi:hypothetical protein